MNTFELVLGSLADRRDPCACLPVCCLLPCLPELLLVCLLLLLLRIGEVGSLCLVLISRGEVGGEASIGSSATHSPAHGADLSIKSSFQFFYVLEIILHWWTLMTFRPKRYHVYD